jgi:DMSO reductase anchor subunit
VHPAYSVILFTVSSGAGYGMLFLMSILAGLGRLPIDPWFSWPAFVIALGLISVGLLSSLLHLGHPERFLRALTQWRSSWLSREGVLAIGTFGPAGLFALGWLFFEVDTQSPGLAIVLLSVVTAVLCVATVFSTSMIYASLKPIPQWCRGDVPYGYLTLSFASGALLLNALAALTGSTFDGISIVALIGLVLGYAVKTRYWRGIRAANPLSTAGSAIGLEKGTSVRSLDPPHTEPNYLQKEMGYRVARKHADKLRQFAYIVGFGVPVLVLLIGLGLSGPLLTALAVIAAVSAHVGIVVERWLFFAEATHAVTLYYGAESI